MKQITFKKRSSFQGMAGINPLLNINDFSMNDENKNSLLDAGEKVTFLFYVTNSGSGVALDVLIRLSIINEHSVITQIISADTVGNILPYETKHISVMLEGIPNIPRDLIKIRIEAIEKGGRNAIPSEVEIRVGEKSQPIDSGNRRMDMKEAGKPVYNP